VAALRAGGARGVANRSTTQRITFRLARGAGRQSLAGAAGSFHDATNAQATGATSITVNVPAVTNGDAMLAAVLVPYATIVTPPSGWPPVRNDNTGASALTQCIYSLAIDAEFRQRLP
jgi:hypothetical protein